MDGIHVVALVPAGKREQIVRRNEDFVAVRLPSLPTQCSVYVGSFEVLDCTLPYEARSVLLCSSVAKTQTVYNFNHLPGEKLISAPSSPFIGSRYCMHPHRRTIFSPTEKNPLRENSQENASMKDKTPFLSESIRKPKSNPSRPAQNAPLELVSPGITIHWGVREKEVDISKALEEISRGATSVPAIPHYVWTDVDIESLAVVLNLSIQNTPEFMSGILSFLNSEAKNDNTELEVEDEAPSLEIQESPRLSQTSNSPAPSTSRANSLSLLGPSLDASRMSTPIPSSHSTAPISRNFEIDVLDVSSSLTFGSRFRLSKCLVAARVVDVADWQFDSLYFKNVSELIHLSDCHFYLICSFLLG